MYQEIVFTKAYPSRMSHGPEELEEPEVPDFPLRPGMLSHRNQIRRS